MIYRMNYGTAIFGYDSFHVSIGKNVILIYDVLGSANIGKEIEKWYQPYF